MRKPEAYTCTKCRHVSIWDGGTNGHTHHCDGTFAVDPDDMTLLLAAHRLGGTDAAFALIDALNTERNALPGVSGTSSMGCSESGFWGAF